MTLGRGVGEKCALTHRMGGYLGGSRMVRQDAPYHSDDWQGDLETTGAQRGVDTSGEDYLPEKQAARNPAG